MELSLPSEDTAVVADTNETETEKKVEDDYVIRLGYYNCDHMTAAFIGEKAGIFEELGLKVEVTGGGQVPQAMTAGHMDVGYIGVNNVYRAFLQGAPIVIGADNHIGGSYYLVVSNDIKKPEDLIGKRLGIGTSPENSDGWRVFTEKLNLPLEAEHYEAFDFASDRDKFLALKLGQIDGYMTCDPWGSMAEYEEIGYIMANYDRLPNGEWGDCCALSFNREFIEKYPELASKMVLAHSKSLELIYMNPLATAKYFSEVFEVPEEIGLMTIYRKTVEEGRSLRWSISEEYMQREMDWKYELGFIEAPIQFEEIVNVNLLKESGANDFDTFIKENVDPVFPIGMSYEDWLAKAKEIGK